MLPNCKHICEKLWLYHNTDEEKKVIFSFSWIKWSLKLQNLSHLQPVMLCAKWVEISLRRYQFWNFFQCIFATSQHILSPLGKGKGFFIWTNLNPRHKRKFCVKFCWNCSSGSGVEDLKKIHFSPYFVIISPWKRTGPSYQQTWIPYNQGRFVLCTAVGYSQSTECPGT